MRNLLKSIIELPNGKKYYYNELNHDDKIETIFQSEKDALDFIKEYYREGRKEHPISLTKGLHTASVYFIGCLLQEIAGNYFSKYKDVEFTYMWFLIALYHDEASSNEKLKGHLCAGNSDALWEEVIDCKNIENNYAQDFLCYLRRDACRRKTLYTVELIKNYLLYRYKKMNCLDHGIVGGLLLYNSLRKNYESKKYMADVHCSGTFGEWFTYGGKNFSKNHFCLYARAALAIVCHNIWNPTKTNKKWYRHYGLEVLENRKIFAKNDPIGFLLCLIDTIEPIKAVGKAIDSNKKLTAKSATEILSNIDITYYSKPNKIEIKFLGLAKEYWSVLSKNIKDMPTWLSVKITEIEKGFTILYNII